MITTTETTTEAPAEATSATPPPPAETPAPITDSLKRPFDETRFRKNLDGTPRLDSKGRFIPLKLGRRSADGTPATPATPTAETPDFSDVKKALETPTAAELETMAEEVKAVPTAENIIGIIQTVMIFIGDEEGILTETEKLLLRDPLNRLLKKYEIGDDVIPDELGLLLAVIGLVVNRLKKPKTATAFAKMKAWAVEFIFRRRGAVIQRVVAAENPEEKP